MITETNIRRVEPDVTVFEIAGRLNLGNTLVSIENTIKRTIDDGARKLVVDLSGLTAIDSSGVGLLVTCSGHMEKSGGKMRVAGAHDVVARVFEVVHMSRIVPLDPDVETSRRALLSLAAHD